MRQLLFALPFLLGPSLTLAQDQADGVALVVGNSDYAGFKNVTNAELFSNSATKLGSMGFTLFGGQDLQVDALLEEADAFTADLMDADRSLVVLAGQFVTDGRNSWFVGTDTVDPSLMTVARSGLQIESLLTALSLANTPTILALGVYPRESEYAPGLRNGIADLEIPEGVTLVTGSVWRVNEMLVEMDETPGYDPLVAAEKVGRLLIQRSGDDAPVAIDTPAVETPATVAASPSAPVELPDNLSSLDEQSTWTAVSAVDTETAYARYLDRFPGGKHASQAVARLAELRRAPSDPNAVAERALGLDLQARQAVQRDLTVLGFDTRGIDGIFGTGTRGAIRGWQDRTGVTETGYLTAEQIPALRAEARARSAELEAQAAQRRAEQERQDRALWQQTQANASQAAYSDYLEQFPDGLFAETARAEIEDIRQSQQAQASAEDRAAWNEARERNRINAYRAYIERPGEGEFEQEARTRIEELEARDRPNPAAQREAQLGMDPITLQLVESRLAAEGLDPGAVDGQLDDQSRRAIRRYQRDRGLNVTGFLDQATVSRMLVDAIR
ncbi:hypothetical protein EU805_12755 [Salipiger sp. IMCC34102]|uniref:peptidoglycan-binding domain-containing protein n=1 Tax=Salipiger sp. IMCC34102 TaxID=2510647 RepID=UPI00101CD6C4|nr:peptidoglycan-binding domain-containing protein [Salipiger sp. IMCC34102]RYH01530.1 hypothetical protein EU805_12755 [Salipiger sp. IMCC34102]